MATIEQLKDALVRADQAGDYEAANLFAADIKKMQAESQSTESVTEPLPGPAPIDRNQQQQRQQENLVGGLETIGTVLTGGSLGYLGQILGGLYGTGEALLRGKLGTPEGADIVQRQIEASGRLGTYLPQTQKGQEFTQKLGGAIEKVIPDLGDATLNLSRDLAIGAILPGATSIVKSGVTSALPQVTSAVTRATRAIGESPITGRFRETIRPAQDFLATEGPTRRAANVDPALIREAGLADIDFSAGPDSASAARIGQFEAHLDTSRRANDIGIKLTEGRIKKDPELIKKEDELLRSPAGKPLRENIVKNLEATYGKLSRMIEESGAQNIGKGEFGQAFIEKFERIKNERKAKVDEAYRAADESAEANTSKLELYDVVGALNKDFNRTRLKGVRRDIYDILDSRSLVDGGSKARRSGSLEAVGRTSFKESEAIRQELNDLITPNTSDPSERLANRYIKQVIAEIDKAQQKASIDTPNPYLPARELYKEYSDDFRSTQLLRDLLETKGDTVSRKTALEKISDKLLDKADAAEFRHLKDVLERSGEDGAQILSDLKGLAINRIRTRSESRTGVSGDTNQITLYQLQKNINDLKESGRVDELFTPQQAADLDLLQDVATDAFKIYDKTVNFSGTAAALEGALKDLSNNILNAKIPGAGIIRDAAASKKARAEVKKALNYSDALEALQRRRDGGSPPQGSPPPTPPSSATETVTQTLGQ